MTYGCSAPKKIISSTAETLTSSEKQSEAASSELYNFADTTKKQEVEVTYFKIKFYPPDDSPVAIPDDPAFPENLLGSTGSSNPKKPPNRKGAVKSIEGYTVIAKSQQSGVNKSNENTQVSRNAEKNEDISRQAEVKEQPAPDPYRWRYILAIVISVILAGVGAYFVFRKAKLITGLISVVKKLF
jgi:hypothetical protein